MWYADYYSGLLRPESTHALKAWVVFVKGDEMPTKKTPPAKGKGMPFGMNPFTKKDEKPAKKGSKK